MADHITTIRLKTVGMDVAGNEVDAYTRKREAAMVREEYATKRLAKAENEYNAAMSAGNPAAIIKATNDKTSALERQLKVREDIARIDQRAGVTDPSKGLDFRESDIVSAAVKAQEKWKDNAEAFASEKRSFDAELAQNDKNRAVHDNADLEAADEAAWKTQSKWDASRLKEEEDFQKEFQSIDEAAWKMQLKLDSDGYKEKLLATEKFEAEQIEIRQRGVEAAQRYINKIDQEAEGVSSKSGGGGFNGFGGKMILGMAAGRAAGDIIGDQHGGREIGSAVSGFMFGGPEIGGAILALDTVSEAFKASRENTIAAEKSAKDYTESLKELSDEWSGLAAVLVKGDVTEESMRKVAKSGEKNAEKAQAVLDAQAQQGAGSFFQEQLGVHKWQIVGGLATAAFGGVGQDLGKLFDGGTPASDSNRSAAIKEEKDALASRKEAIDFERSETPKVAADNERIAIAAQKLADARTISNEKLREEAVLTAELSLAKEKDNATFRQQMALAQEAVDLSSRLVGQAKDAKDLDAQVHAQKDLEEAITTRQTLQEQWSKKLTDEQISDDAKISELKIKHIHEDAQIEIGIIKSVTSFAEKAWTELYKKNLDIAKANMQEELGLVNKINYYKEVGAGGERRYAEHTRNVQDLLLQGKSQTEAEKLATRMDQLSEAEEHFQAMQEVKKAASEAQFKSDEAHAKTKADRDKAKHDYEYREEQAAHPNRSKDDIEASIAAKDAIDQMKGDRRNIGEATERYTHGYVNFRALNLNNQAGQPGRKYMTDLDAAQARAGTLAHPPKGYLGPTGSISGTSIGQQTPTEKLLADIKLILKNIELNKGPT